MLCFVDASGVSRVSDLGGSEVGSVFFKGKGGGVEKFWTFFSKFLKRSFFMFCGYFGHI